MSFTAGKHVTPTLVIIVAVIIFAALLYLGRARSHSYRPSATPVNQN
jgi:hypothetical protein